MFVNPKKKKVAVSGEKQTVRWACQYYWTLLLGWALFGLRLGFVSSYYWTLVFGFAFLLPLFLPPADQLCIFFYLTDLGFIFYIYLLFLCYWLVLSSFLFFSFLFSLTLPETN